MRVRIWGCRGSLPSPGPETVRYGGNTSCVEVRLDDGTLLILDAGTGIRQLGNLLEAEPVREVHLLLSHLHLDHVIGLGFFAPLFTPGLDVHLWGPRSPMETLGERIARYLSPPLFPVHLSDMQSRVQLHDVPTAPWQIGGATIMADLISHNGPTLGFRVSEGGRSLAYMPDHEPALGVEMASLEAEWLSGYRVAHGADLLLHDAQYTDEEYLQRIGFGHSSVRHAVTLAQRAEVRELVLFHHDPLHSDDELEAMLGHARELWGADGTRPTLAFEGMELDLSERRGAAAAGTA